MKASKRLIIISRLLVILWMALIFVFSAQPAGESNHLSISLSQMVLGNRAAAGVSVSGSADIVEWLNVLVRKFAHFFLFFVLGLLAANAVQGIKTKMRNWLWISAAICFLYAISDELHQLFVPGRYSSIKDITIDTVGAILGVGIYWIIGKIAHRKMPG